VGQDRARVPSSNPSSTTCGDGASPGH